jgi:hypothetical protein
VNMQTAPVYPARTEVTVVDIQMPFGSMVVFILKWTLAAIPAIIILTLLGAVMAGVLGGMMAALVGIGSAM